MTTLEPSKPWEDLSSLLESGSRSGVKSFVEDLHAGELVRAVSRLDEEHVRLLLTLLDPEDAAGIVDQLPDQQAAASVETLEPEEAALIVQEMPSAEQADLLREIEEDEAQAILLAMDPSSADEVRRLSRYASDVAGGLMGTEFLSYSREASVESVIKDLRANSHRYSEYVVQYAYIIDKQKRLTGVLRLRDLLLSPPTRRVKELMLPKPVRVSDEASLDELRDLFDAHSYFGVPVTDSSDRLVGVLKREAVEEALAERSDNDYLKSQGIVHGEELRSMPLFTRSRRRLMWLSLNIGLNFLAASVIALYEETLTQVIALAVFLPIISDMSGCSGNQAVAVSMRELSLGVLRPQDIWRVWSKEVLVGFLNGVALGLLIGTAAWLWKGNPYLGLVVGGALALNTMVAVSLGGTIPLILRSLKMDPALASGPILTTVTDMFGFLLTLSAASFFLAKLAS